MYEFECARQSFQEETLKEMDTLRRACLEILVFLSHSSSHSLHVVWTQWDGEKHHARLTSLETMHMA